MARILIMSALLLSVVNPAMLYEDTAGCPLVPPYVQCVRRGDVNCRANSECCTGQKCCPSVCGGRDCKQVAVMDVKAGACPYVTQLQCYKRGDENCKGDSECSGTQKCCNTECGGKDCKHPTNTRK